jgi:hypothetical protein
MPTVLRINGYRIGFFSADGDEPLHVQVSKGGGTAKFWLEPIALSRNLGFAKPDLNEIERLLRDHQQELLKAWHDYFR